MNIPPEALEVIKTTVVHNELMCLACGSVYTFKDSYALK
jgi:hypothetical protein